MVAATTEILPLSYFPQLPMSATIKDVAIAAAATAMKLVLSLFVITYQSCLAYKNVLYCYFQFEVPSQFT
jgi:hypothetical protein